MKNFIPVLKENIKRKMNWSNALRFPIASEYNFILLLSIFINQIEIKFLFSEQSGIFLYMSDGETFEEAKKTMITSFPSKHFSFLKF